MKTICIDARLYGIAHTGIGRYTENLINFLPHEQKIKVILIVSSENMDNPHLKKFQKVLAHYHPYAIPAQFEMLGIWAKTRPGILHATHSSIPALWPGKIVVTFHDLIRHLSRGQKATTRRHFMYWIKYLGYLFVDFMAMWRSVKIIVPSNFWKSTLHQKYRIPLSKISVTYEGVDSGFYSVPEPINEFNIKKPFIVYTGNAYPHKNLPVLLKAVKLLEGQINLALVGSRGVFTERIQKLISELDIQDSVFVLGRLSDDQISHLYSGALAFVFPSLIEGFGLTGLEAMAVGLPVIAARASCLPEVYGQAALYFDPSDPVDLKEKILTLKNNPTIRSQLIKKGHLQAKKYSWAKMSEQTWQIYQSVLH